MKIYIAGASGAIGRPLIRLLVGAGHEVVGMTRSNADVVRELGAEPAVADAFDRDAVLAAVERSAPDVVVNQLTDLSAPFNPRKYDEWLAGTNRLRSEGTRNLVDAAVAAGAQKFVSQSIAFAYRMDPGLKTEEAPMIGAAAGAMGTAVTELEQLTLAAPGGIVLRYGFFYGPGTSYTRDGQQAELVRKGQLPVVGGGHGAFPFIHVDDAASATVAAIERGAPGVYNIVDDEPASVATWLPVLAESLGARAPMRVPRLVGRLLAGETGTVMMTELRGASNAKAKQALGWAPRHATWRDGFRELGTRAAAESGAAA